MLAHLISVIYNTLLHPPMHPSTPYLLFLRHPLLFLHPCEECELRQSVAEKANHSEVTLMDKLREDKIPDANIFVERVKEIVQKLCE